MLTRSALRYAAAAWTACLIFVSLHRFGNHIDSGSMTHRISHVAAFGVLALLLLMLGRNGAQRLLATVGALALAMATEFAQYLDFRQPFEWWDVRDDGIGILLALALVRLARTRCTLKD